MPSSGMWRRVGLVRQDVSEECIASIFKVERISEVENLAVTTEPHIGGYGERPNVVL
jgi:hypothetical protein